MEELKINDEMTREIFINAFKEGNLVPILGAGFTVGMPARDKNTVPNGEQLKMHMIKQITKVQNDISEEELKNESFSSVAELFERNYTDVQKMGVTEYFYKHFTGVKIKKANQLRFLNDIKWKYIYTLNIDTGIEESDYGKWEVFYPNKKFDERLEYEGKKKLYKIHGDANCFIKSGNYNEMILSESQYICSLDENKKFHDMLAADCENKNILYLGCSLNDEIDIKYSVLSDKYRNFNQKETYRIYITAENMTTLKKAKLEGFNISHYIKLQENSDYELFYEFLIQCYEESQEEQMNNIDSLSYQPLQKLDKDLKRNIAYLADIKREKEKLPYYYFEAEILKTLNLTSQKINVISGRRFVGKTMLAYNILDYYQKYQRYFITAQESVDTQTIHELMELKNALIVFDSDSVDDKSFMEILNSFNAERGNIICLFVNSYDDVLNLVSYHTKDINQPLDHNLVGKMSKADIQKINKGLDSIGIAAFSEEQNLLDNTLRIANVYKENIIFDSTIVNVEDLIIVIWVLVQNRMYYEEIVSLGLSRKYKDIVQKFSPFLQEEKCKRSELRKHSAIKIVCNGKLGLLQLLNNYAYPQENEMGTAIAKSRHRTICDSIYHIMYCFDKAEKDSVKKFIMFDTLNDIFSRKYSQKSINYIETNGKEGKDSQGAAGLIQEIYNDDKIQQLKAGDPNYWLQRAKSVYITYYKNTKKTDELYEGIKWAIKAEQDSEIKMQQGEKQYRRTMSNATIQIAMMYGRIAKIRGYSIISDNNKAVEYYYKGLLDTNNRAAAKTLLNNSKGTEDLNSLIKDLVENPEHCGQEWRMERDYLIKIGITGDVIYSA